MNMDREPKKREGQYSQRRGYSGKGSYSHYKQSGHASYNNLNEVSDNEPGDRNEEDVSGGHGDITRSSRSLNAGPSGNLQGSDHARQSDYYRNSGKHARNYSHRSYSENPDSDVPKPPSQRGQIVGGRYIRKQGNQFGHSRVYRNVNAGEQNVGAQRDSYSSHKYGNSSSNNFFSNKSSSNSYDRNIENCSSESSRSSSYQPREYNNKKYDSSNESVATHSSSYQYNNKRYDNSNESTASHNTSYQPREYNNKKYNSSYEAAASQSSSYQSREHNNKKYDGSSESMASHRTAYQPRKYGKKYEGSSSNQHQDNSSALNVNNFRDVAVKEKSSPPKSKKDAENNATQRELLISRLHKGECECLVCCEHIRTKDQIWHCLSCYHVFHLRCIKKWARSPAAAVEDGSWRCPACQSLSSEVPFHYYCFCGARKNPEINYHLTPHSCGEICDRSRPDCSHHCKELCHPGPCPPCVVVVQKTCQCGKTRQTLPCNQAMEASCQYACDKPLNCEFHKCIGRCHEGDCLPCEEMVEQKCYCGKSERRVACTTETASCSAYSCESVCSKTLLCGRHICAAVCHPGDCDPCRLSPEAIQTCCCGKSRLDQLVLDGKVQRRTSCEDPVPVCGMVCGKTLFCGPKENPHTCRSLCHEGDCPVCPLSTSVKCNCGSFTKDFPCAEMTRTFSYKCEKRCNRRKDCGRHKCLNHCCTNWEHQRCELVCNKKLSCSLHLCQETCHMGNCPTCWNVSFDELRCYCGTSVLYPPIHCGTKPPECPKPCTRNHPCDHDVKHTCHSDDVCPPCTSLTTKWCYGKHKQCGPVMCFLDGISCGMPCQKPLPCGRHKCRSTCHAGECLKESEKCTQPCSVPRPSCGHACGIPCHDGPCIETPCKAQVTSNCPCGRRSETTTCFDSSKSYRLMSSTILATKMQEIKDGQSVNLNDVLGKKSKNNKLQCNEECAVIERNKRLALALQIQNPDLSCSPGPPGYSEFLKEEAKKNPHFVADVYDKLSSLVQLATESKHKNRRHAFPPMNRDQRRVVHELAEFFGCQTESYDDEPKKNVVATAVKNKCWLPFTSIMAVVQRDMGIRKGPTPMLAQRDLKSAPPGGSSSSSSASSTQKKKIDYFDYNE